MFFRGQTCQTTFARDRLGLVAFNRDILAALFYSGDRPCSFILFGDILRNIAFSEDRLAKKIFRGHTRSRLYSGTDLQLYFIRGHTSEHSVFRGHTCQRDFSGDRLAKKIFRGHTCSRLYSGTDLPLSLFRDIPCLIFFPGDILRNIAFSGDILASQHFFGGTYLPKRFF